MREIKFLAYVNNPIHGKGVFPVKSIHFDPFVCEIVMGDEIVNFFDFDDITLLEYTGLKDSNGKEIYEGDILKNDYGDLWVVVWEGTGFMLALNGESKSIYSANEYYFSSCEVVGNIYEKPELLEGKK